MLQAGDFTTPHIAVAQFRHVDFTREFTRGTLVVKRSTNEMSPCCTKTTWVSYWAAFDLTTVVLIHPLWQNDREVNCLFHNQEAGNAGSDAHIPPKHAKLRSFCCGYHPRKEENT
jgi:hypothetical protein